MEAYIEKKKAMNIHKTQGVPDSLDRVRVIGNPSGSEGAKEPRCETPPAVSCRHSLELEQLSSTPHLTLGSPDRPTPPSEQAAEHIDPIPEADPPSIDLAACNSVVYEERNGVPGVKFAVETHEEWTPVTKAKEVKRPLPGKGNGTKRNPVRSKDEVLRLCHAKEVTYAQLNGTPGLTFRSGKTMHSYQWSPIAPASPIATRTRTKFKT